MRVLIVSVTAGNGHNTTAKALEESLTSRGADVVVLDMYKYISRAIYSMVDKGYLFSTKHMPRQFGNAYSNLERNERSRKLIGILNNNGLIAGKFASFFRGYMPDAIITTHVFAAQVLDVLKRQGLLSVPVIGIITDYCIHPFWEEVDAIDYIVTASELLRYSAERKGIAPERLLPFGIPVSEKFNRKTDRGEARRLLGLDPDKTTIVVMGGSMGFGKILHNVAKIDEMDMGFQIVCICGNNEKLYRQLHLLKTRTRLHIKGFTDQIDLYMDAADCIVTKPGGLTITEIMAKGVPMILTGPIPGQEERNADFLMNNGAAVLVSKYFSVAEAVYYVLFSQGRLELMRRSIQLIAHRDAAEKISRFTLGLGEKRGRSRSIEIGQGSKQ